VPEHELRDATDGVAQRGLLLRRPEQAIDLKVVSFLTSLETQIGRFRVTKTSYEAGDQQISQIFAASNATLSPANLILCFPPESWVRDGL
jgi:hypothetical protein